jgi:AraC family transcriptional regulator, positive regulator of tynA and feaB
MAPPGKAFSVFREGVCKGFMPWSPEYKSDREFQGRIEALAIGQGSIGRFRMSPLVAVRSKQDIANSAHDCFYGHFVVSGGLKVEQSGRSDCLKVGDLVVHDGSTPTTFTSSDRVPYEVFTLLIPKDSLSTVRNGEDRFRNAVFTREQMIPPLSSCLRGLTENMLSSSANELGAVFDACVALLPVAAKSFKDSQRITGRRENPPFVVGNIGLCESQYIPSRFVPTARRRPRRNIGTLCP